MSGRLRFLVLAALLLPATAGAQATLNKCIDAHGGVTYSNLPCKNAREVQKVEVDPAPPTPATPPTLPPAPAQSQTPAAAPAPRSAPASLPPAPAPASKASRPPSTAPLASTPPAVRVPRAPASAAAPGLGANPQCERLSAQLGQVLDRMDQARRQGASAAQMDEWNNQIRELERKKQQTGCF